VTRPRWLPSGLSAAMGIAAAIVAAALTTLFALLLVAILSYRHASVTARHAQQVIASANQLETTALDLETGLRGFAIAKDRGSLARWEEARDAYRGQAQELLRLSADNRGQEQRARGIKKAIDSYLTAYSLKLLNFIRRNPGVESRVVAAGGGLNKLDVARNRFKVFIASERQIADERNAKARSTGRIAIGLGAGSLALAVLLIVLLTAYLARRVARPIRITAEAAGRLADGDLSSRVEERGVAEVGDLQQAFNTMAASLERGRHELEDQNRKLRESERVKSELVSSVSHELRTPLASILGFSDLMLQRDLDAADRRRYLQLVRGEADRLAALLNDLLDLQRIEEGGVMLTREDVDLSELLASQVVLYSAQSEQHHLELDAEKHCVVDGDRDRLAQVVGNLLSNAIKYSPDGGVVRIEASRANGLVRVTVQDEGMGIPTAQQSQIFTKFFRGDAGRRLGIGGTGLGLALSRDIVEAHGGRIGFESGEGEGSTFWFELPAPASARPESGGVGLSDSRRSGSGP
jgi:signal transduction histidine kinase